MYVIDHPNQWEIYLQVVEFSYNNGYHSSLKVRPFEAMYGRKCNTFVGWDNPTDRVIIGPELLRNMEDQRVNIKQNFIEAQDRKKSYANRNRIDR